MQLNSSTNSGQFKRSSAQLRSVRSCADQCSLTQLAQLSATLLSFVQLKRRLVQPSAGWRSSGAAQAQLKRSSSAAQAQLRRSSGAAQCCSIKFKRSSVLLSKVQAQFCAVHRCGFAQLSAALRSFTQLSATLRSFVQLKRRLVQPSAGWLSSGAAQAQLNRSSSAAQAQLRRSSGVAQWSSVQLSTGQAQFSAAHRCGFAQLSAA